MCGILGYVGTGFSVSRFAGALRLLAHRGPFGEGIAALPNGAIGMTRLPMSGAAAVPLPPQEGQRRVAYNGEVYQAGCEIHGEIRLLLDGLQRGVLPDGMYALASWDPQTRQLTLLRDEFGIKPLYYSYQPERGLLAFASEPRALLHLLGGARADAEAIAQVVAAGVPLEGQTLFQQVRLLLPGEVLRFDLSQERPRLCQRQRLATAPASEVDSLDEQLGETLERCRQTFRPCALLVSGGVDSNLLGSYLDPQLQRFHLCLEGDEESLLPHPRLQRFELRQEAFMPLLRRAVGNFGGATRMSSLLMYQRLADGIGEQGYHCVLLGEGVDELFWGYPRHLELWRRRDAPEPRRFAAAWFGEYRRKAALLAEPAGRRVAERIEELAHEALGQGLEAAIGQFDLHYSLEPLLRRADHLLMSRTIEARTPYLHGALAQRAGRLQRIVGDTAKAPLVALLEQREKRWQAQPKRHFRLPFERWPQALGEMRRHLAERLPALHDLGLEGLDAPSVAALPGDQLFTLTTLSLWQQEYGASL
ncbi:asparagine synthetase B family protein [Pseudomonas aeruginosa]|uniref:asparagine synthase-related protein n=1 Tax=Pseudomonas aeruginosa TaxID=287 RepID=UPI0021E2C473|nr:asparagine synthetase B [Pseudomonas aeruginosa]MCV0298131.1 asparagine synthetase B [Pseudomonas aeruginosa]MCV0360079.1 asparagine synthetase B [Pseudomonas aeruginosa]MDY1141556.1 asparagine synthetase B [Pseudomonas aeruginosa]MDY1202531.1 asparagine synthetase B [Pseudomonas aeruginosa]MDY1481456.1 asparagine synthetase B [Pseudomonas aeruginosa]